MSYIERSLPPYEKLKNGMCTPEEIDRLTQQQRDNTGRVTQMKGVEEGGWVVQFPRSTKTFVNLGGASEWCKDNMGIINDLEGKRLCGQTIDELRGF